MTEFLKPPSEQNNLNGKPCDPTATGQDAAFIVEVFPESSEAEVAVATALRLQLGRLKVLDLTS